MAAKHVKHIRCAVPQFGTSLPQPVRPIPYDTGNGWHNQCPAVLIISLMLPPQPLEYPVGRFHQIPISSPSIRAPSQSLATNDTRAAPLFFFFFFFSRSSYPTHTCQPFHVLRQGL